MELMAAAFGSWAFAVGIGAILGIFIFGPIAIIASIYIAIGSFIQGVREEIERTKPKSKTDF